MSWFSRMFRKNHWSSPRSKEDAPGFAGITTNSWMHDATGKKVKLVVEHDKVIKEFSGVLLGFDWENAILDNDGVQTVVETCYIQTRQLI